MTLNLNLSVAADKVLAIDPGSEWSAWVLIDAATCRPIRFDKNLNADLRDLLWHSGGYGHAAIEMVASYGMAVGAEVFETVWWSGRFYEAIAGESGAEVEMVKRQPVKLHHCRSAKAKDSNIVQALTDRFAPGLPNFGKGTKAAPGWFYGFTRDIWQAYALAVYVADEATGRGRHA